MDALSPIIGSSDLNLMLQTDFSSHGSGDGQLIGDIRRGMMLAEGLSREDDSFFTPMTSRGIKVATVAKWLPGTEDDPTQQSQLSKETETETETETAQGVKTPLSLVLPKPGDLAYMKRVANAAGINKPETLSFIAAGSGGAVFEYQPQGKGNGQQPEAIKFHFHSDKCRPKEIETIEDLQKPPAFTYGPSYKSVGFCAEEKVWFHKMATYPATLNDLLRQYHPNGLPESVARLLIRDLLTGLAELHHDKRMMHRDIKPGNLLLTERAYSAIARGRLSEEKPPYLVIIDYGLAKALHRTHPDGRHTPNLGTFQYRAAYTDQGMYHESIDVSSAGFIFFEMIMNRRFNNLKPQKPVIKENKEQYNERQRANQRELVHCIEQQLTGGDRFKKDSRNYHTPFINWISQAGGETESHPSVEQCLGLFRTIYGEGWEQVLASTKAAPPLSARGFLALFDLLRQDPPPDTADKQLQKNYWVKLPGFGSFFPNPLLGTLPEPLVTLSTWHGRSVLTASSEMECLSSEGEQRPVGSREAELPAENIMTDGHCPDSDRQKTQWRIGEPCPLCTGNARAKKYSTVCGYTHHEKSHYLCPVEGCNTSPGARAEGLVKHLNEHHSGNEKKQLAKWLASLFLGTTVSTIDPGRQKTARILKKLVCLYGEIDQPCGQMFAQKIHLDRHLLSHTGKKPHKCEDCGRGFTEKSNLERHRITHSGDKPHKCEDCGKGFARKSNLEIHRFTHTGENPHQCEDCGKRFAQKSDLRRHRLIHTGEKPHQCKDCGKRFTLKFNLKNHQFTHTNKKPHICQDCGKGFAHKGKLKQHRFTHTGEKPHKCEDCGKGFARKFNLESHRITTHTGEKPHKCEDCGKGFTRKRQLQYHLFTHTG